MCVCVCVCVCVCDIYSIYIHIYIYIYIYISRSVEIWVIWKPVAVFFYKYVNKTYMKDNKYKNNLHDYKYF